MNYAADARYDITITQARRAESEKGTLSLNLRLSHPEHGDIYTDLWLTEGAAKSVRRTLAEFGFDSDAKIRSLILTDGKALEGMAGTILTKLDSYGGKDRVKVAFLNGPNGKGTEARPVSPEKVRAALMLFGATPDDDDLDVPF